MSSLHVNNKKIKWNFPSDFDFKTVMIGIPATEEMKKRIGIDKVGQSILPKSVYGINSRRNSEGYSYADKTRKKEMRVVNTISYYPYGNTNADERYFDIERLCFPKVKVAPTGIELLIFKASDSQEYIIADLRDSDRTENTMIRVVNLFYEIFGECYLFTDEIKIDVSFKRTRCNWIILPPGVKPSDFIKKQIEEGNKSKAKQYFEYRLRCIESHNPTEQIRGQGGFNDYFAYLFSNICVLESGFYGNATYIVKVENWKLLSQMTKQELSVCDDLLKKITHDTNWEKELDATFSNFESKKEEKKNVEE